MIRKFGDRRGGMGGAVRGMNDTVTYTRSRQSKGIKREERNDVEMA